MANEEQLSILKQGGLVWNEWREFHMDTLIDLSETSLNSVNLSLVNLIEANLTESRFWQVNLNKAKLLRANLRGAKLSDADLRQADLRGAKLSDADLRGAKLGGANLGDADLSAADLSGANLSAADLSGTNFNRANLNGVNLRESNLRESDFSKADLSDTDFEGAILQECVLDKTTLHKTRFSSAEVRGMILANVNLQNAIGLDEVRHAGPSAISMSTLARSQGKIPEIFLKGCGVSDWEIESAKLYQPDLRNDEIVKIQYRIYDLRATQAIQLSPLFISYSHQDSKFVNQIDQSLTKKGIRFWRDVHDMKAGRMEKQIDQAIRQNPTLLLVLSKDSLESDWVEHEVRTARGLEKEMKRDVLCPIALDNSWKSNRWPARVMEQIKEYNILDFSDWQNEATFEQTFNKLVDGLGLFYK
jgi:uncharacterized protein YjbI with pentapeptide repeats